MLNPPLTQSIGSAERSMRALLERTLHGAGLSFLAWTALVFTSTSPQTPEQVAQRQIAGHLAASAVATQQAINQLMDARLVAAERDGLLFHTNQGAELFKDLSSAIEENTDALYGDLPIADLAATHRTLLEIAKRANRLLASNP